MNKKSKKCFAIILTIITLVVGMISMLAYYYKNRLPIGLWVNGIYCTGKTIDEVIQVLNPNTSVNRIEVQYINSQGIETNMPIYPEDFGEEIILIDTSSGEVLNEILKREKQFFLTNRKINSSITYQYNENELTTKVNELWDELDISEKKATDVLSISNGTEGFYLEDPKKTILKESKCKEARSEERR